MEINLTQLILGVISLVLSWGITQATNFVRAKSQDLQAKTKNDALDKYIQIAEKTVIDTVRGLNQSMVVDLKKAAQDGKLTDEEKKQIQNTAITVINSTLSENIKDTIGVVYGDLPSWIKTQVEIAVANEKKDNSQEELLSLLTDITGQG